MKLFISYSGAFSKATAKALAAWIPSLFGEVVEPFVSEDDTQKGSVWFQSLRESLDSSDFGIICLADDNLTSEWLLYEAGALFTRLGAGKVWPILFSVKAPPVASPLSQLQHTRFDRDGMRAVMRQLYGHLPDTMPIRSDGDFNARFNKRWSYLNKDVRKIKIVPEATASAKSPEERASPEPRLEPVDVLTSVNTQDWPPLFDEALRKLFKLRDAVVRIGPSYRTFVDDFREETRQLDMARALAIQATVVDAFGVLLYHDKAEQIGDRLEIIGDDGLDGGREILKRPHGAVYWPNRGSNIGLAPGFARCSVALFTTCGENGHRLIVETHEECSVSRGHTSEAWRAWKQRQYAPAVSSLDAWIAALMSVRFERVEVVSFHTAIGNTLTLQYTINNPSPVHIEAWLGAEIECSRTSYSYVSEDKAVTLAPGRHEYIRTLTVSQAVQPGLKLLTGGLWIGKVSDSETSLRLAIRSTSITLTPSGR
jgi:hypothetical protein